MVCSFSDALWGDSVYKTSYPLEMVTDIPNVEGEVAEKSPHIVWTENIYKSKKGVQMTIKHLGTIYVSSEDGGTPSAQFNIRGAPSKCRRSQTGMFYGLLFHYGSDKNSAATATLDASIDIKFDEVPTSNRLPFEW